MTRRPVFVVTTTKQSYECKDFPHYMHTVTALAIHQIAFSVRIDQMDEDGNILVEDAVPSREEVENV